MEPHTPNLQGWNSGAEPDYAPSSINQAALALFGISYLFPYQRLVVANIMEAAATAAIPLHWPPGIADEYTPDRSSMEEDTELPDEDRAVYGNQIVILPTGAGKSLCFQLPALLMDRPTLVIYPLLGLMADQERRLRERGVAPILLRGGQDQNERDAIWKKLESRESTFIITNPETLLVPQTLQRLEGLRIAHIVIDEAHCVSEWGDSFRPAYLEISRIIEAAKAPLVTAFTATASAEVLERIESYIFPGRKANRIIGNPDRQNIAYKSLGCLVRDLAVRDLLLANDRPGIVFCSSREGTQNLASYLRNDLVEMGVPWGREIRFYHAGLEREEKQAIESWFLPNTQGVLIATCAFGMGIDKSDIRTVIHRDCPPSVEAYLQESGRAGRDSQQSAAILLWGPEDARSLRRSESETERRRISNLLRYARNSEKCRREALSAMLDYDTHTMDRPELLCCDVCSGTALSIPREETSLLEFFRRNARCYTVKEAATVLSGSYRWTEHDATQAIRALIKAGSLKEMRNPLWKQKITPTGIRH